MRMIRPRRRTTPPWPAGARHAREPAGVPAPGRGGGRHHPGGAHLEAVRRPQGSCRTVSLAVRDRTLHALIGPNGAGKTTAFNLISGMFKPDTGSVTLRGGSVAGFAPEKICEGRARRSFQITNCSRRLTVEREHSPRGAGPHHPGRFDPWRDARRDPAVQAETTEILRWTRLAGLERARPARCPTAASACSTWGWARHQAPRPAPRRAARRPRGAERTRIGGHHQAGLDEVSGTDGRARYRTACSRSPTP